MDQRKDNPDTRQITKDMLMLRDTQEQVARAITEQPTPRTIPNSRLLRVPLLASQVSVIKLRSMHHSPEVLLMLLVRIPLIILVRTMSMSGLIHQTSMLPEINL